MNVTNLEMAQASIEIFCALSFIMAALIVKINKVKMESIKIFRLIFVIAAVNFCMDAFAYIFRGNVGTFSIAMTRISNFTVFTLDLVIINLFVRYIYWSLQENGIIVKKTYQNIVNILFAVIMVILVVNIFNGWMYSFDEQNNYCRNQMWYVYTAISLFSILVGLFVALKYRKGMNRSRLVSIALFALIPAVSGIVQAFYYGITFTNIGVAFGIWIIFLTYVVSFVRNSDVEDEEKNKSSYKSMIILLLIMVVIMSASIISCILSINRICLEKSEKDSQVIAHMVSNQMQNEFLRPIYVAKTMARDYDLILNMKMSESEDAETLEDEMITYLEYMRSGFDYETVFAVCDYNKAYYTCDGITKYLNPQNDKEDYWYPLLIDSDKDYDLEVKSDQENQLFSVYVNQKVFDEKGNFVGVCGVSVEMEKIRQIILDIENTYDVKINLIDENGVIQIDSDITLIGTEAFDTSYFPRVTSKSFYYENVQNRSRMTMYMEDLGWYLVVVDNNPVKINAHEITVPSIIIFIGGLLLLALTFSIISLREQKTRDELLEKKKISITDELTGLLNRRAYEDECQNIKEKKNCSDLTVVMIDVNGLKAVNDSLGHKAGDELIISATKCMNTTLSKYGKIYRVGGDEFVALLHCSREKLEDAFRTYAYLSENWTGVYIHGFSVSKGAAFGFEHKEYSFEELQELADKNMYEDKQKYYERTGKIRRT